MNVGPGDAGAFGPRQHFAVAWPKLRKRHRLDFSLPHLSFGSARMNLPPLINQNGLRPRLPSMAAIVNAGARIDEFM
jgi:hypothetical protein